MINATTLQECSNHSLRSNYFIYKVVKLENSPNRLRAHIFFILDVKVFENGVEASLNVGNGKATSEAPDVESAVKLVIDKAFYLDDIEPSTPGVA